MTINSEVCGKEMQDGWMACPFCGGVLQLARPCDSCGAQMQAGWKACPFCGGVLQLARPCDSC
ncbi:MAG: zinc ribbon domain-containing protein, partial [bacterium]